MIGAVSGQGADGYREALEMMKEELGCEAESTGERARPTEASHERAARARDRLAELVAERELDALIVGDLVRPGDSGPDAIANVRWLTGFTGTSALAVVGPETADLRHRLPLRRARRARGRRAASSAASPPSG